MAIYGNRMFNGESWLSFYEENMNAASKTAENVSIKVINGSNFETRIADIVKKFLCDPIELDLENMSKLDPSECTFEVMEYGERITINGFCLEVHIPFTGSIKLLDVQPPSVSLTKPKGSIQGREIVLQIRFQRNPVEDLSGELHKEIEKVQAYVTAINNLIENYNNQLEEKVSQIVRSRLDHLKEAESIVDAIKLT